MKKELNRFGFYHVTTLIIIVGMLIMVVGNTVVQLFGAPADAITPICQVGGLGVVIGSGLLCGSFYGAQRR